MRFELGKLDFKVHICNSYSLKAHSLKESFKQNNYCTCAQEGVEQQKQKLDIGPLCFFLDLSNSLSDKEGRVQQEDRKKRLSFFSRANLYNFAIFSVLGYQS